MALMSATSLLQVKYMLCLESHKKTPWVVNWYHDIGLARIGLSCNYSKQPCNFLSPEIGIKWQFFSKV